MANKPKENVDIYKELISSEDCNWQGILKLEKNVPQKINQSVIDYCIENVGNFNLLVEKGVIKIGD
jgi:hypothetical protein